MPRARARGMTSSRHSGGRALSPSFVVTVSALAVVVVVACSGDVSGGEGVSRVGGGGSSAGGNGTTRAGGGGSRAGGSAGGSAEQNPIGCPGPTPRMSDPCAEEAQVCIYGTGCLQQATCKGGLWKIVPTSGGTGSCNPPAPCPEDEPADVETETCSFGSIQGGARCRYPRSGCFVYLACLPLGNGAGVSGWRPTPNWENTCDSCCPLPRPTIGDPCTTPGLLCWSSDDADVICRDGGWSARAPFPGAAGAGGTSDVGGAAGSGGIDGASCPESPPLMNDPCTDGPTCRLSLGCADIASTCIAGRYQVRYTNNGVPGCEEQPDCPLAEPQDAAIAACAPGTGGPSEGACRYPHGSCYRYLECGEPGDARWHAPRFGRPADSCCPKREPAAGSPCDDDGALCSWASLCDPQAPLTELTCANGAWQPRP